jgi:ribonuclease HII
MGTSEYVVGIDEAGRGPLAGPVAVGVVCAPYDISEGIFEGVQDSKKLSPKAREMWYERITTTTNVQWAVACTGAAVIDKHGIQYAVRSALARALTKIVVHPDTALILLDGGLRAPDRFKEQQTIIRGDATEPLISAASVLAKVTRDRYMCRADARYPQYGLAVHKGYGTQMHQLAILQHGLCPLHRKSFIHF